MITINIINETCKEDINIKNEPFKLFGFILPSYNKGKWDYEIEYSAEENIAEMCFPDENYDYDELSKNSVFVGAYDGKKCIGLAILQQAMLKYMYLYDLKVNADYRGRHVGTLLIEKSKEVALEQGYRGIYTQG